jgi:hypothetical protein
VNTINYPGIGEQLKICEQFENLYKKIVILEKKDFF